MTPDLSARELQRQQTRRRLYECALAVFRKEGVGNCRIEEIAKAAGVSRGAFYFHFPTKNDVLLERVRETEGQICAAIEALPADTALERVLAVLIQQLAKIWENDSTLLPDVTAAALYFTASTMSDHEALRLRALLCARFRAASTQGQLSSRLPGDLLGDLYLGHMLAGLLAWYAHQQMPLAIVLSGVTELFFTGARADTKRSSRAPEKEKRSPQRNRNKKKERTKWKR
jgi:AcrR family transcriptional regulator